MSSRVPAPCRQRNLRLGMMVRGVYMVYGLRGKSESLEESSARGDVVQSLMSEGRF